MAFGGDARKIAKSAYLAGIIDGEGCLRIGHSRTENKFYARICVGMVEKEVTDLLKDTFGGYVVEEKLKTGRTIYRWNLCNADGIETALNEISPFLIVKRKQADLLLDYVSVRNTKLNKISDEETNRRKEIYLKCQQLNKVGANAL